MIQTTPPKYGYRGKVLKSDSKVVHYGTVESFYGFKSSTCGNKSNKQLRFSNETKDVTCKKCISILIKRAMKGYEMEKIISPKWTHFNHMKPGKLYKHMNDKYFYSVQRSQRIHLTLLYSEDAITWNEAKRMPKLDSFYEVEEPKHKKEPGMCMDCGGTKSTGHTPDCYAANKPLPKTSSHFLELWETWKQQGKFNPNPVNFDSVLKDLLKQLDEANQVIETVAMYGRINHDRPKDYRELCTPYIAKYIPNSRENPPKKTK